MAFYKWLTPHPGEAKRRRLTWNRIFKAIAERALKETSHLLSQGTMPAPAHMSSKFITQFPLEIERRSRQSPAVYLMLRPTRVTRAYETSLAARCMNDRRPMTLPPSRMRPTL